MKLRFVVSVEYDDLSKKQSLDMQRFVGELTQAVSKKLPKVKFTYKTEFVCPWCGGNCQELFHELVEKLKKQKIQIKATRRIK